MGIAINNWGRRSESLFTCWQQIPPSRMGEVKSRWRRRVDLLGSRLRVCRSASGARLQMRGRSVANKVPIKHHSRFWRRGRRCYWPGAGQPWSGGGCAVGVALAGVRMSGLACCTRAASVTSWGDPAAFIYLRRSFQIRLATR